MSTASSTLATVHYLSADRPCRCRYARQHREHHDRLLQLGTEAEVFLELMELAVTWGELDYSESSVIAPNRWLEFVDAHIWADGEKVERMVSLATDVALGSTRAASHQHRVLS
jgi:hypothetical protein